MHCSKLRARVITTACAAGTMGLKTISIGDAPCGEEPMSLRPEISGFDLPKRSASSAAPIRQWRLERKRRRARCMTGLAPSTSKRSSRGCAR